MIVNLLSVFILTGLDSTHPPSPTQTDRHPNRLDPLDLNDNNSDEKTPVPSPSVQSRDDLTPRNEASDYSQGSSIVPVDIFVKHEKDEDLSAMKTSVIKTQSDGVVNEIRPSLLARAQLFFQKQIEVLTSPSPSSSTPPATDTKKENPDRPESSDSQSSRLTNVSDTVNQNMNTETETVTEKATVRTVRKTTSLPPANRRHVTPGKLVKQEIHNRDKSPYRLIPEVNRRNNPYLQAGSPSSSQGC